MVVRKGLRLVIGGSIQGALQYVLVSLGNNDGQQVGNEGKMVHHAIPVSTCRRMQSQHCTQGKQRSKLLFVMQRHRKLQKTCYCRRVVRTNKHELRTDRGWILTAHVSLQWISLIGHIL